MSAGSWTFTSPGGVAALLAAPGYGEAHGEGRRQIITERNGRQVWVQDLTVDDRFHDLRWEALDLHEWGDILKVLRSARWAADKITIDVAGDEHGFAVGLAPGQEIMGVGLAPGQDYSPGDIVRATTFSLAVYLAQSQAEFEQQRRRYGALALRFRLITHEVLQAGG